MIVTVDIPTKLHKMLHADKRRTGMSKSLIIRQILFEHYKQQIKKVD
jgi:hypothetical protein